MLKNEAALFCTPYANMRAQRNCLGEKKTKSPETNKTIKRKIKTNKRKTSNTKPPHQTRHYIHRKTKHQKLKTKILMEYICIAVGPALESG